jgi:hypothetical protein
MKDDAWGNPNYFVLLDHATIDTRLFTGLPTTSIGQRLYLVEFQAGGIEVPSSEPIGVYHYAGIRRFIWKDKFYSEYNLDYRPIMERVSELITETYDKDSMLNYRKLLDLLKHYGRAPAPNFNSTHDHALSDPERSRQRFVRAIYAIE